MAPPNYFVYVLISQKDSKFYIGFTKDLKERLAKHKKGQFNSTKPRRPLKLIFVEIFLNKFDALRRENYLKTTKGKQTLKNMLKEYLKHENNTRT